MTISIGIIGKPVAQDHLDINIHSKSLINCITDTITLIKVGIQGEWGGDKTMKVSRGSVND